jgi:hypothetical protein
MLLAKQSGVVWQLKNSMLKRQLNAHPDKSGKVKPKVRIPAPQ